MSRPADIVRLAKTWRDQALDVVKATDGVAHAAIISERDRVVYVACVVYSDLAAEMSADGICQEAATRLGAWERKHRAEEDAARPPGTLPHMVRTFLVVQAFAPDPSDERMRPDDLDLDAFDEEVQRPIVVPSVP